MHALLFCKAERPGLKVWCRFHCKSSNKFTNVHVKSHCKIVPKVLGYLLYHLDRELSIIIFLFLFLQSFSQIPIEVICRLLISGHLSFWCLSSQYVWSWAIQPNIPALLIMLNLCVCVYRFSDVDCINLLNKAFSSQDDLPRSKLQGSILYKCWSVQCCLFDKFSLDLSHRMHFST